MPQSHTTASAEEHWRSRSTRAVASLALTTILCLPSLLGGAALLAQIILYRDISEWRQMPSAFIALGSIIGGPLVTLAAVVGGIISFSDLPARVKYAHLFVIGLAAVAALSLLLRFSK